MPLLHEHPLIDLKQSKIDKQRSNPSDGVYHFIEKKYIDYSKPPRPDHWLTWVRYDPQSNNSQYRFRKATGYVEVQVDDGLYCPEYLAPNENGWYILGDLILMQYPLIKYVKERLKEDAELKGGRERLQALEAEFEAHGAKLPQDVLDKYKVL